MLCCRVQSGASESKIHFPRLAFASPLHPATERHHLLQSLSSVSSVSSASARLAAAIDERFGEMCLRCLAPAHATSPKERREPISSSPERLLIWPIKDRGNSSLHLFSCLSCYLQMAKSLALCKSKLTIVLTAAWWMMFAVHFAVMPLYSISILCLLQVFRPFPHSTIHSTVLPLSSTPYSIQPRLQRSLPADCIAADSTSFCIDHLCHLPRFPRLTQHTLSPSP